MAELFRRERFDLVIDATHPYAKRITESIAATCAGTDTEYLRLLRPDTAAPENAVFVEDAAGAAEYLDRVDGNILLTTGSRELHAFASVRDFASRAYARVLPMEDSLRACREAGLPPAHILAMQGPFSRELNAAMLRSIGAAYLVTKASGSAGGFEEKIAAAAETGAVPVIIGSAFLSALDIVDSSVMMYRLQGAAGVDANSAIAMKGWLGTARKYFDLPNAVIVPISTIVLPMLSGAIAKKEKREINRISTLSLRMTLMVAIPSAAGLCIFAKPICALLLYSRPEFAANTAPLLAVMAPAVITASLLYTTNSMIQAVGKVYVPVINMIVGTVVRIGVVYVLCGIPEINAMGSAVGTFVSYLVMIILNLIALHRMLPEIPSVVRMGIRPLLASVIMGAVSYPVYLLLTRFMSEKFAVIPVILLAILVYLVAAVFTKAITREEIVQLPKGEKLADKLHLK